jgi:hypothetical protein
MRVAVGLDRQNGVDHVEELVRTGADEFFAGIVPPVWTDRYGWEIGLNRRTLGPADQYNRYEELGAVIAAAHGRNRPVLVTFNAQQYCDEQMPFIRQIITEVDRLGPDGYIVADPALILLLGEWGIRRPLHLSTIAGCYNSEAVRHFCGLGDVRRLVLPRKMSLTEMAVLVQKLADLGLEFEAMVLRYRCYFSDELCFTWHSGMTPVFCAHFTDVETVTTRMFPLTWKQTLERVLHAPDSQFVADSALDRFVRDVSRPVRQTETRPSATCAPGAQQGMAAELARSLLLNCGLCALPVLQRIGVNVIKLPARGEFSSKARFVSMVRAVADNPAADQAFCRALVNSPDFCSRPGSCYYAVRSRDG